MPSTLYALFREKASQHGDRIAVQGLHATDLSYAGFVGQIDAIISALAGWGIGRGDRVLIQLANGPEVFTLLHAVGAAAVAVLIDPRAGADEADYFLRFTEPKAIILEQGMADATRELAHRHDVPVIDVVPTPERGAGTLVFAQPPTRAVAPTLNGPDDLAFLIATSGTTAQPKLVPKTQRAMLATSLFPLRTQFRALGETVPINTLNYLPMQVIFGSMMASAALASGGVVACMPGFRLDTFYNWLDTYRPIQLIGPPAMLEQVLALAPQHQEILSRHSLRYVSTGAAPLTEAIRSRLNQVFHVPIVQTYGMTEVDIIAQRILPVDSAEPNASLGQVEDRENIRIVEASGAFAPVGEVGEVVLKYALFEGYWRNSEADEEAFIDGWFRTGDEGFIDAEGHLTLVGRVKEVINNGGAKVSPYEVEMVLKQYPGVVDAAVFGLKQADVGETVAAAVVGSVTERELRKFAAERLPFFKVPTRIILVDAIPTTASGKVQRNRLAQLLGLI